MYSLIHMVRRRSSIPVPVVSGVVGVTAFRVRVVAPLARRSQPGSVVAPPPAPGAMMRTAQPPSTHALAGSRPASAVSPRTRRGSGHSRWLLAVTGLALLVVSVVMMASSAPPSRAKVIRPSQSPSPATLAPFMPTLPSGRPLTRTMPLHLVVRPGWTLTPQRRASRTAAVVGVLPVSPLWAVLLPLRTRGCLRCPRSDRWLAEGARLGWVARPAAHAGSA